MCRQEGYGWGILLPAPDLQEAARVRARDGRDKLGHRTIACDYPRGAFRNGCSSSYFLLSVRTASAEASPPKEARPLSQRPMSKPMVLDNQASVRRRVASSASGTSASVSLASRPAIPPRPWPTPAMVRRASAPGASVKASACHAGPRGVKCGLSLAPHTTMSGLRIVLKSTSKKGKRAALSGVSS